MVQKISEIYNVENYVRGKAKEGFIRPTLSEQFMNCKMFQEIISNVAPIANPDSAECNRNDSVIIDLLANDIDFDGDAITIVNLTVPTNGTLENHDDGTVTYTPNTDYTGNDSFNYTISDHEGGVVTSDCHVTINYILETGIPKVFNNASTDFPVITYISDTKAVATYCDGGNGARGTACVLTMDGAAITVGPPVVFETANALNISVTTISDTKVVVTYTVSAYAYVGEGAACILTITDTTVVAGDPFIFETAGTSYISVTTLSETKAVVAYRNGEDTYGTACVLSVAGAVLTAGTSVVFESDNTNYISITALSETKAVVAYSDDNDSGHGTACVLDISNLNITVGTPEVFDSSVSGYISITALSETKAVVVYQDNRPGSARTLAITGTTIAVGDAYTFTSYAYENSVTALSDTKAIVTYRDYANNSYGTACMLTITDSIITGSVPSIFDNTYIVKTSVTVLSETKALVVYRDKTDSYFGTACVLY